MLQSLISSPVPLQPSIWNIHCLIWNLSSATYAIASKTIIVRSTMQSLVPLSWKKILVRRSSLIMILGWIIKLNQWENLIPYDHRKDNKVDISWINLIRGFLKYLWVLQVFMNRKNKKLILAYLGLQQPMPLQAKPPIWSIHYVLCYVEFSISDLEA